MLDVGYIYILHRKKYAGLTSVFGMETGRSRRYGHKASSEVFPFRISVSGRQYAETPRPVRYPECGNRMVRRYSDNTRIDLGGIFLRVQKQMLACLAVGDAFENPSACGSASEQRWIDLFDRYLPQRYRASPAFVVDADGRCSRQIDIAIYDNLYSP